MTDGYSERERVYREIVSAEEKNAAAKLYISFLATLTNEQPCEAGRGIIL